MGDEPEAARDRLQAQLDVIGDAGLLRVVREAERVDRPHLGEFLDRWRATNPPMPMFVLAFPPNENVGAVIAAE